MASKSSAVTATFLHSLFMQSLLFSFVRSDEAACANFCPPVGFVDGWETTCYLQQSTTNCVDSEVRDVPSAPSKLIVDDFVYETQGTRLLALNITWVLPITGNYTGLEGFYVDVIKTSYPVGYYECNGIRFDRPLTMSTSFESEIVFHFSCLRNIKVDSHYSIEITSIGSKQSIKRDDYHTSSCAKVPGVGGCPLVNEPAEEWKPSEVPTVIVFGNTVSVSFSTYTGDSWITYKINLQPCNGSPTPAALSQIVSTNGSTGRYSYVLKDVPPGCYSARVTLYQRQNGGIVDGRPVRSAPFNITRVTVRPTEEPTTTSPDNNVIRTSSQKPGGLATTADVVKNTVNILEEKPDPKSASKTLLLKGLIGAGVGVAVALLLLLTFVVKRQRSQRQSEIVSPQETPRAGLVNNMVQNDLTGAGYCDTYGHGDSVSVFRSECSQCCDCAGYPDNPEDFKSVTNMSGVTV